MVQQKRPHDSKRLMTTFRLMGIAILALFLLVAVLTVALVLRPVIFESAMPEKVDEQNFLLFQNQIIVVQKDVPRNPYAAEKFSYSGDRLRYDDGETQGIFGIDVSYAQEEIDWKKVKDAGVQFAMLRVGFRGYEGGKIVLDKWFHENAKNAAKNGIHVGIYFFSQALSAEEAREEARAVIEWIKPYDISYPVVFDWEYYAQIPSARTNYADGDTITESALAFCEEIKKAGYLPMVYFNLSLAYRQYDLSRIKHLDFWLAELDGLPTFHYKYDMLQYSHTGQVDGISRTVDLNLSMVDYSKRIS